MKFSIKDFFSKLDLIRSFLQSWLNLLKKPLMKNFIFCAVNLTRVDYANCFHFEFLSWIPLDL